MRRKSREHNTKNKGTDMTNEKKIEQVKVRDGFRVADTIGSYYETRYGWSGTVCAETGMEKFEDCFADAEAHGLRYVEVEFNVEDFNEIWAFLTFSPNPKRGRMPLQALKHDDNFIDFYNGVMGFINYDLKPINADTSRAMKRLYDGERFHDFDLHCEASDLASRLDEIARSWIECMKGSATDEDMKRIYDNNNVETCEMTRFSKAVEEILKRENA
jgi:hypothetical protein